MRVLVAPDSWTGFAGSHPVAHHVAGVLEERGISAVPLPMADGGIGTAKVLERSGGHRMFPWTVRGPLGEAATITPVELDGALFIESAQAVGGSPEDGPLDPMAASSGGLGEALIRAAQQHDGPFLVGLGGSLVMDGGLGMAQVLGLTAVDRAGKLIPPGAGAEALGRVARLVGPPPLRPYLIQGWADVRTRLRDCATRYGPQKGATPDQVRAVTEGLARWADVVARWREDQGLTPVPSDLVAGGAAGGLGFALAALLDAPLAPGAARVAQVVGLREALEGVDAVVSGEGRLDAASFDGKVVGEVLGVARAVGVPRVVAFVGQRRGPLPAPPHGPDAVVVSDEQPGADREARFNAGIEALADVLLGLSPEAAGT